MIGETGGVGSTKGQCIERGADIASGWEATSSLVVEISWDGSDTLSSKIDCGHEIPQVTVV